MKKSYTVRSPKTNTDALILTGMIVDDLFLQRVEPIVRPNLFNDSYITIASLCLEHLKEHGKAPRELIWDLVDDSKLKLNQAAHDACFDSLENLSLDDYLSNQLSYNSEYYLTKAERFFRQRQLERTVQEVKAHLSNEDLEAAENLALKFKKIEQPNLDSINPLLDVDALKAAFQATEEPLFRLPGAYGELLNPHLVREGFIAFLGREKIGKTWRLIDLATWALKEKRNVAFFQLGDLSQNNFMVRLAVHLAKKSNLKKYVQPQQIPILDCYENQTKGECQNNRSLTTQVRDRATNKADFESHGKFHETCTRCKNHYKFKGTVWWKEKSWPTNARGEPDPLNWGEAMQAVTKWTKTHKAKKRFKLATFPNSTVNVRRIEYYLDMWEEREGYVPDVIILDYADIMAPEDNGQKDFRHQENDRWKALRRLSQERKCLLITVTQSTRGGHKDGQDLTAENVSEEKRKMSHVTAFFALNQTNTEKQQGIIRIAPLMVREGHYNTSQQACVLQNLSTGQSYIASYWYWKPGKQQTEEEQ